MKNVFKKAIITMCSAVMLMGISAVGVNAATVEAAMSMIAGTARSMGVKVEE